MKKLIYLLKLASLLTLLSCNSNDIEEVNPSEPDNIGKIISLHEVLEKKHTFNGKEITIAAYFVTHIDGSWICGENGDWKKRLETTLTIELIDTPNFILLNSTRSELKKEFGGIPKPLTIMYLGCHFEEGVPVLITGKFIVEDYVDPYHEITLKDHPYIQVTQIIEVEADDPRWKSAQLNPNQNL